jgi:hypothetical protein
MKNILTIICVLVAMAASAQSTSPRFGTAKNEDRTYRALYLTKTTLTDAAGNDTLSIKPNAFTAYYALAAVDSTTIKVGSTATSYYGDCIKLVVTGTSGKIVKFIGTNLLTAGTATLSSNGRAVVCLVFDGTKWVEQSRVVQ